MREDNGQADQACSERDQRLKQLQEEVDSILELIQRANAKVAPYQAENVHL
jgi:hypothetical protein